MKIGCPYCENEHMVADPTSGQIAQCPFCQMKFMIEVVEANVPDTKNCPMCGETILVVAKKCKHCGEYFDGKPKDKTTYCLLAFFLGGVGAHNFYAEQAYSGITKATISLIASIMIISGEGPFYILIVINLLWCIVDMASFDPLKIATLAQKPQKPLLKSRIFWVLISIIVLPVFAFIVLLVLSKLGFLGR